MDTIELEFRFLASCVRRLTEQLRSATRRVVRGKSPRQQALCIYIEATVGAIEQQTNSIETDFESASTDVQGAYIQQLRFLNLAVQFLHETTPWLSATKTPRLRLGINYFVRECSRALLRADPDLILNADSAYMYSTLPLSPIFATLFDRLAVDHPEEPAPIVINYPDLEEESTLLHPVFVHELGHDVVDRFSLVEGVFNAATNLDELNASFASAVQSLVQSKAAESQELSDGEAAVILRKTLGSWLEELCCDLLAMGYLGPSYLFAAMAFLLPAGTRTASSTHPPTALRTALLLNAAAEWGWRPLLDSNSPKIVGWLESLAATPATVAPAGHLAFVEAAVRSLETPLRRVVEDHLGDARYTAGAYTPVADELMRLLSAGILPAQLESGSPVDRRAVLIATWCQHLSGERDQPQSLHAAIGDVDAQRFAAKALEMSVVLERWSTL